MQLTLTHLSFSGTILLLAMSHLLLWGHVTSSPRPHSTTESLYKRVIELAFDTHNLASQVFTDFNLLFGRNISKLNPVLKRCHTTFIIAPENNEEMIKTTSEELLQLIIGILQAWEEPLKLMEAAVVALPNSSDITVLRTRELRERFVGLVERLKTILRTTKPGAVENKFTFWSTWLSVKSPDEDTRNIALYNLARCVLRDTLRIDSYLKVLKCREVHNSNC